MQTLRIFATLFLAISATVSVQAALLGRNPPFCGDVLKALASKRITQVFQSLNGFVVGRKLEGVLCISDSFTFR